MERESDIELSWFFDYWIHSTKTTDYSIDNISTTAKTTQSKIHLSKLGQMPMPIDLIVTKANGEEVLYYIPLAMMLGEKPNETELNRISCDEWPWTHPEYELIVDIPTTEIKKIEIDPSKRMPDIDQSNNILELDQEKEQ